MSIFKNTFPRNTFIGIALCFIVGTASAELLGVDPGRPEIVVFPAEDRPNITYVAATDNLVVNGFASAVVFEGDAIAFITDGRLSINLGIDETGALTGGQVEVTGQFTSGDTTYTSPLLTGRIVEIGFFDDPNPEVINGDRFDFRFELTGGSMAPLYGDDDIGVAINLENSFFDGSFATDWTASNVKGKVGPIPPLECTGTIGDFVWRDNDRDGIQDSGEPGIGNVLVELFDSTGTRIATDRTDANGTDANGEYGFTGLCAGDYTVRISSTDPDTATALDGLVPTLISSPGSNPTNDSDNHGGTPVTLTTDDSNDDTIDFGYKPPVLASLGDFVWEDLNGDGVQDNGEPGVAGVTVNLYANCNADGTGGDYQTFTTTDSVGFYEFTDLMPGNYCVEFVLPNGYAFTGQDLGGDDTADSDADPDSGRAASTDLVAGENDPTWDAGLYRPASLGDFVWYDINQNGIQDANEAGIDGVTVELYDCAGEPISSTMTYTNAGEPGYYIFDNLAPGDYRVKFIKPDGYAFSPTGAGTPATDSDASTSTGETTCVTLASGENNDEIDAGLYPTMSRLGDFVWEDLNADGIQDDGEPGIAGVTVELLECGGDVIGSTVTNESGFYYFEGLAAGSYQVRFDLGTVPSGFIQSPINQGPDITDSDADSDGLTACVTLDGMDENLSLDAGFYQLASLGDFVWLDGNRDGIQGPDEDGVLGVRVDLFDCDDNFISFTTTAFDGSYSFTDLTPGGYTVMFTPDPALYTLTTQDQGGEDDVDSDAEFVSGKTDCITLQSGEDNPTIDAGLVRVPVAECDLSVTATCAIIPPLSSGFVCSDAKPLDTLEMKWTGQDDVRVVAHYGEVDEDVVAEVLDVDNGEIVSISGFAGASNNVEWEIFAADGSSLGVSQFHISCSDDQMNDPSDCGTQLGDGKGTNDGFNTDWLLEGLVGLDGDALQCTPPTPGPGAESCEFTTPAGPHCQGKVEAVSLRYVGGDCIISNTQEDKAECLVSGSAGSPVRIRVSDGGSKVYLDTGEDANVMVGDVVVASAAKADEDDFGSNTVVEIFSSTGSLVQEVEFHTSCSKPLNLGDQFGAVEVVGLDTTEGGSASLGADVFFRYSVTNNSIETFADEANDSFSESLGSLGKLTLAADGGSADLERRVFVIPDGSDVFVNTFMVTGELASGKSCSANVSVPVTRKEPPAPQLECSEIKPITDLSMVWNGADGVNVLTVAGQYFANIQNGDQITFDVADLGNEVGMTLSGSVDGYSSYHVSCSDDGMDGPEDCGTAQGNSKDDDLDLNNQWLLGAMIGESGSFTCPVLDDAPVVEPSVVDPGTGTGSDSIVVLESLVDGNRIKIEMENLSNGDLFIESVDFTWPKGNELKKFKFNGDFAKDIEKTSFGTSGSIMLPEDKAFEDDPNKRKIKSGEKRKLEIEFDADIEKAGLMLAVDFTIKVIFSDGSEVTLP